MAEPAAPSALSPGPAPIRHSLPADLLAFMLGYLILLPLYLAPLLSTRFLPTALGPLQVALTSVMDGGPHGAYTADLRLAPYVLHHAILLGLSQAMSLAAAYKVLVALYVMALPLSVARLLSVCGRSRLPALLAYPLAYNLAFYQGLLSYLLALPLLFFFLGQLADNLDDEHEGDDRDLSLVRDVALALLWVALYLCDLSLFLFALAAGPLMMILSGAPVVYRIRAALTALPALVLGGLWQGGAYVADPTQRLPSPAVFINLLVAARSTQMAGQAIGRRAPDTLGEIQSRLIDLPSQLLAGFRDGAHVTGTAVVAAGLVIYFMAGVMGVFARRGDRDLPKLSAAGLSVLALALALYVALPARLPTYHAELLYQRFGVIVALLLGLLVPGWLKRYPRWGLFVWLLPGVALAGYYGMELTRHFDRYGLEIADFCTVLDQTPPGGKAVALVYDGTSKIVAGPQVQSALPWYYSLRRGAAENRETLAQPVCGEPLQPCSISATEAQPPAPPPDAPGRFAAEVAVPYFDYFFVRGGPGSAAIFGARSGDMEAQAGSGSWVVYKKRGAGTTARKTGTPPSPASRDHQAEPAGGETERHPARPAGKTGKEAHGKGHHRKAKP